MAENTIPRKLETTGATKSRSTIEPQLQNPRTITLGDLPKGRRIKRSRPQTLKMRLRLLKCMGHMQKHSGHVKKRLLRTMICGVRVSLQLCYRGISYIPKMFHIAIASTRNKKIEKKPNIGRKRNSAHIFSYTSSISDPCQVLLDKLVAQKSLMW